MGDAPNLLGQYLRARRELVTPDQVGIPSLGVRRVPGLRREEVAMLAGVSADYYLRLEQGRDRNPSVEVLESLARVLQLDEDSSVYLLSLATGRRRRLGRRAQQESVPVGILKLLDTIQLPAFVEGRYFDVLAANQLVMALSSRYRPGSNRMRDLFLNPAEQDFFPDWEIATRYMVAGFRESVGPDTDDPRFVELVGELSLASQRFRELWARHDVFVWRRGAILRMNHPQVGEITLNAEKLAIPSTSGMTLAVYHPDAGSENAVKLALLSVATAPPVTVRPRSAPKREL
jgi:transcriptional regulator with XRE-family HTH domain